MGWTSNALKRWRNGWITCQVTKRNFTRWRPLTCCAMWWLSHKSQHIPPMRRSGARDSAKTWTVKKESMSAIRWTTSCAKRVSVTTWLGKECVPTLICVMSMKDLTHVKKLARWLKSSLRKASRNVTAATLKMSGRMSARIATEARNSDLLPDLCWGRPWSTKKPLASVAWQRTVKKLNATQEFRTSIRESKQMEWRKRISWSHPRNSAAVSWRHSKLLPNAWRRYLMLQREWACVPNLPTLCSSSSVKELGEPSWIQVVSSTSAALLKTSSKISTKRTLHYLMKNETETQQYIYEEIYE